MAADSYRPVTTLARDEPPGGPRDQDEQGEPPTVADLPAVGDQRGELVLAREIRAREMVAGLTPAQIAAVIRAECLAGFCTTWIRAHRLALGIALADVVAQVRARYVAEGRKAPRFSETLLSAYESGQKRPGPEYLHYLCAVYRADPADLGYDGPCLCGRPHRDPAEAAHTGWPAEDPARPAAAWAPAAPVPAARRAPEQPPPPGAAAEAVGAAGGPGRPGAGLVPGTAPAAAPPSMPWPGPASGRAVAGSQRPGEPVPAAAARPGERPAPAPPPAAAGTAGRHALPGPVPGSGPEPGPAPERHDAAQQDAVHSAALREMLLALLANPAAAAGSEFFGAVEHIRRGLDTALLRRTVSVTMLDQWEESTAGYGARYMTVPPLRLLCDILLDLGDVHRMCAQRQPIDSAERLCRLAAQLAGLVGITLLDLGDQRLARAYFRTARTAADETGDRRLRAWVAVREALVPLYYGDPIQAAALARAATDLAGRNRCVAAVMSRVTEARALARLAGRGRREALERVRTAFDQAEEGLAELSAENTADTAFGYTERQLLFHAGDALAAVGDHQGARRSYSRALRLYPPGELLDRSLVRLGEARSLAETESPDEALRIGEQVIAALPAEHRTEIVLAAARGLAAAVAARHPGAAGLPAYVGQLRTGLAGRTAHARAA